jgi:hypothetical protein
MPGVEVVGVYPVEGAERCHLIEIRITDSDGRFELFGFTQATDDPRSEWQVPYDEKLLDPGGTRVERDLWDHRHDENLWRGDLRLVFFFHFLEVDEPLLTPWGSVELPPPSQLPERLSMINYENP